MLRPTPFTKPRKSPNSYHWTKQALLQEPLILPLSQRPTIIQVFLPSRILLMVDVFPLKNFPRKQTLIGNGGNSGGGGGRYKKREEQITFHHNFKYAKLNGGNWLLLLTITVDISIKGVIFKRINNENGTMMAQLFSLKAIPKSFTASHCYIITALSWPRQAHHKTPCTLLLDVPQIYEWTLLNIHRSFRYKTNQVDSVEV